MEAKTLKATLKKTKENICWAKPQGLQNLTREKMMKSFKNN
jgi:hypothetical protein